MIDREDTDRDPRIGSIVAGKYRVFRLLGRGGMGSVYEAQNVALGKRVALKFIVAPRADPRLLERFHREARAISAVESAHIVQVFDTGETDAGEPFLVMELLQGESLGARIRAAGRLSAAESASVVIQALRGLRRAHAAGIVHRDLKPDNLLLVVGDDDRTVVKIVDFGLSKTLGDVSDTVPDAGPTPAPQPPRGPLTQEGAMIGTPLYMSPEQMEGRSDVDARSDLWSAGAILFEALAGAPPFPETSYARLAIAICRETAPDVRTRAPDASPALARVVARALARDRAKRFQTAEEFITALLAAVPELDRGKLAPSHPGVPGEAPASGDPAASGPGGSGSDRIPGAELRTYTAGGATLWLSQSPALSIWRGEVAAPDRLRIEARDGNLHELRLEPVGPLRLGRAERVGEERNELVYPDVASRLAATLRHDGVRWWLRRREECSVPVQVGARTLARGEEAPLVHGTLVCVGGMRATVVDRRYVAPTVPAGTVDAATGLLGRAGLEQECASLLQRQRAGALVLVRPVVERGASQEPTTLADGARGAGPGLPGPEAPDVQSALPERPAAARAVAATLALHRASPSLPIGHAEGTAVLLVPAAAEEPAAAARRAADAARAAGVGPFVCGWWTLAGEGVDAGRELELSLHAIGALGGGAAQAVSLRDAGGAARFATSAEVLAASGDGRRATLLFGIEEQSALGGVGPHVIAALEQELAAVVASHAGGGALVSPLAPGVVAASVARKLDPAALASAVQCDWHARPPIMDGKVELSRTLSWEILHNAAPAARAAEISRECNDPHGVLSALSGGLPYPIAGRVHAAIAASSAIERVKMLFDVLEGTWRFIAGVLVSAFFHAPQRPGAPPASGRPASGEPAPGFDAMVDFHRRAGTRDGLSLGTWRELARTAARAFEGQGDPIGAMAREVLEVKLSHNQTFETLSNLMQAERNSFAHGHYGEARAAADLPEFEQMTRTLLRALRPLCAWTLVTVEKTEPDLYGELQTVEFVDHTGPFPTGTRRRIGLNSPVRLANVVYLARFREGLVLPLDPMVRRLLHEERFDLYWMDHLPRAGACQMSPVVGSGSLKAPCDVRRLPPLLRALIERASAG